MHKGRSVLAAAVAVSLLGITTASGVWAGGHGAGPEQGAGANRPAQPVEVVNDDTSPLPVEVLGTALIEGPVEAAQAGDWTVGIAGTPTVELSGTPSVALSGTPTVMIEPGTTTVISSETRSVNANLSAGLASIDVSKVSSIRVSARCGRSGVSVSNTECAKFEMSLYDTSCGCELDSFTFPEFTVSRVYEVPGTTLTIGALNSNTSGPPIELTWKIFGRA